MTTEERRPGAPWCPQHNCHPDRCFEIHYPDSSRPRKDPKEQEKNHTEAIIREHIRLQNESIRREQAKMSRSIIDARKQFEASKARSKRRKGA